MCERLDSAIDWSVRLDIVLETRPSVRLDTMQDWTQCESGYSAKRLNTVLETGHSAIYWTQCEKLDTVYETAHRQETGQCDSAPNYLTNHPPL